jgi:hypothetical protein
MKTITSAVASQSGFTFKVVSLPGTVSDEVVYSRRKRVCGHGCLRIPCWYRHKETNELVFGFRCPAENVEMFTCKGGDIEETVDRRCLGDGLLAGVDLGNPGEPPIITLGDDATSFLRRLMKKEDDTFSAKDVMEYLLG